MSADERGWGDKWSAGPRQGDVPGAIRNGDRQCVLRTDEVFKREPTYVVGVPATTKGPSELRSVC
jgi:hypothetical protein